MRLLLYFSVFFLQCQRISRDYFEVSSSWYCSYVIHKDYKKWKLGKWIPYKVKEMNISQHLQLLQEFNTKNSSLGPE